MHWVQALIARTGAFAEAKLRFPAAVVCPLTQGLSLVPITERFAAELAASELPAQDRPEESATEMEPGVSSLARRLSATGPAVYAATYIHGGTGGQDALVWVRGELTLKLSDDEENMSKWPNSPISRALRHIGVSATPDEDEFDALGLGRYRSSEAWARAHGEA